LRGAVGCGNLRNLRIRLDSVGWCDDLGISSHALAL
jgi:hypothetical protein